jgi:hypothetical protein
MQPLWKTVLKAQETKNRTIIWSSNTTPRDIPGKSWFNKDPYTLLFISALFTVAKLLKEPRCPMTDEWKKEICWNYSRNGRRGIKENDGGVEFNYDVLYELL